MTNIEGLAEVVSSNELFKEDEISHFEFISQFADKTIMKFYSLKQATVFTSHFVHKFLIPKYGKEEVAKFPLAKSGPWRDGDDNFSEMLGVKQPNPEQETWLVIPRERYSEVQDYINTLQ